MRAFFGRWSVLPFEMLIAGLVVVSGGLALLHVGGLGKDALSVQLPSWLNIATNAVYVLSGLSMLAGVGLGRGDVEAFGLAGIAAGVVARSVALLWFIWVPAMVGVPLIFNGMVVVACAVRLASLIHRKTLLMGETP